MVGSAGLEVLTPSEMLKAEAAASHSGRSTWDLMWNAGCAIGAAADAMTPHSGSVLIVAGPGNNGGDGFVAAEYLRRAGRRVRVLDFAGASGRRGDAALAERAYAGPVELFGPGADLSADLVVDALFGSGLSRPVTGAGAELIERINAGNAPVLAVDLPSGVDGRNGAVRGAVIRADRTLTFFRFKPGHLLYPGRMHCGATRLAQIGVPDSVLAELGPKLFRNAPELWRGALALPTQDGHKYQRGHALVVSGPAGATGAARLSATAALRIGAGLVTLASPPAAMAENAAHLTAVMLRRVDEAADLSMVLEDHRFTSVAIGPGAGIGAATRDAVASCLRSQAAVVLDADAVTAFAGDADKLFGLVRDRTAPVVMTPHDGEFARLFPDLAGDPDKVLRAREAAARSGATVVLKGPDTVVAAPDGRACINNHAAPWLATAGSGDVLTGMIAGLLAGGMPAWEAAGAAVWMHGDAARRFGPGLIAEDIPAMLPAVLRPFF